MNQSDLLTYLLRLGDNALVLGHRLSEWSSRAPLLEEDIALSNLALDLVGQARLLYDYAGRVENKGRSEDDFAFLRDDQQYRNALLVEQPNGDFAWTMARQFFFAVYSELSWRALKSSRDEMLAGIAAKAVKEMTYHVRHSGEWLIRLGDGSEVSHVRAQAAVDGLAVYTGELFEVDATEERLIAAGIAVDPRLLEAEWRATVERVLREATLQWPKIAWMQSGGRAGRHSEHLSRMLAEMQSLHRAHPGAVW